MRVQDKVAIVTGGASGIGQDTCIRLAEEGARVAIFDINLEGAKNTAQMIEKMGSAALALKVDVSKATEVESAVKDVISTFGGVDILVNNAGTSMVTTVNKMTEEVWDRVHEINLKGVFLCCKAVAPNMQERRYGKIVNISSILGNEGTPNYAHYSSTKAGVIGFTRGLATELGPSNINVNAIGPGLIETPLLEQEFADLGVGKLSELREGLQQRIPLRRVGVPRDIANAILFLVSDEASYITGQCLFVCGGWSAA